jgi:DNA (cytosine-5)-methyltransferase 1
MSLTYGELFAGYGGMYMGLSTVLPGSLAWYSENAAAPSKVMAHHHPHSPNLGDVTKVDWATVPPVNVLTGGTPCQDLSGAGMRAGMHHGTRSGLWASMASAIETLHPDLVVWENVRGATSASAYSAVESCEGCMGDGPEHPAMRALGRVLGDLASLRYDAWWIGLQAAYVGAAHKRWRLFVFATPADAQPRRVTPQIPPRWEQPTEQVTSSTRDTGRAGIEQPALLPTPISSNANGAGAHGLGSMALHTSVLLPLLPTPAANDMGGNKTVEWWDDWTEELERVHHNQNGHGKSLAIEAKRPEGWEQYLPALERWESVIGRPPPARTEPGTRGGALRLAPAFSEWMMGLPEGHVTAVPGIAGYPALTMLGNGVVPQQVAAAAQVWLRDIAP